jgi:hypothetical protein
MLKPPPDISLPFFAYGLFRPGQIAYFQIRQYVQEAIAGVEVKGQLRIRDGLPMIDPDGTGAVEGVLIHFRSSAALEAYDRIAKLEPDKQYRWDVATVHDAGVNTLFGRSPRKGSIALEETDEREWNGWNDPLFTTALGVVEETIAANRNATRTMEPLFRLQMAYLLLWSAIERYVALRYHLAGKIMEKIGHLGQEPAFAAALSQHVSESRTVIRADHPQNSYTLQSSRPAEAVNYYYQIRSNITHRGKGVFRDHETLLKSAAEMLYIFRTVLTEARQDARS